MPRSQIMKWKDRLNVVENQVWTWYHLTRVDYYNKPDKLRLMDKWMKDVRKTRPE